MRALILIERDPPSFASWPSLIQKKRIPELSVEKLVDKYQGFEGEMVCFFEIDENKSEFEEKIANCLKFKELGGCFLLYIISGPDFLPPFLKERAIKLGYDVGCCEEESTVYSSIFHEIIFGYFDELASYKELLNENCLFPEKSLAEKYVELHNHLSAEGKGVEDYMEMTIYEIWRQND